MDTRKTADFIRQYSTGWKRKWLYAALLVVILVAGGWFWYQSQSTYVPQEFYSARDRAAEVSTRIDQLTNASVITLGQISKADEKGDYRRGLQLVQEEIDRNEAIKEEAVKLSEELKTMALNLGAVRPKKGAEAGLQAATTGLELTQHLIAYNDLSQELLGAIQERLKKNGLSETRQKIEAVILRMNEEAATINSLNEKYQEEMGQFDKITGR